MASNVAASPLQAAQAIAPLAAAQAADAEHARQLTGDVAAAIREAGLFRLAVPATLGGGEAAPADLIEAVEALAAGDGAAGWCVAVCATAGMLAAYLEPAAAREVYGGPESVAGGVFAPKGRAVATPGGTFTVDGRWPFASNVAHCDWLMGGCMVLDGDTPRRLASGRPDVRLVLFPAADAEVIDTWSVSGLRATGSHDIEVRGLGVPAGRSASLITDAPREPGPLYAFPPFGLLAASIAAAALGIARGAIDETAALAAARTPALGTRTLAERPGAQAEIARAEAEVRAARALLHESTGAAWAAAQSGGAIPPDLRAGLRLAATHATEAAAGAVDRCWRLAGGSALYESGALQRRFRDVHAATQHMLVAPGTWELAGRVRLGVDTDLSQL
ncbi:MAG: acyl-CoA dehydrogenase family protein [Solirubrobacteraceae bacterium]